MSKNQLTEQKKLFIVKQQKVKEVTDDLKAEKQLDCMHRWVLSRKIYRKLKPNPPDWFKWLENALDGTHYSITEETFNLIKEKYENYK